MVSKKFLNVALFAAALSATISFAGQAQAAVIDLTSGGSVKLADLVGPESTYTGVQVGDKVFSGFRYTPGLSASSASAVTIFGIDDSAHNIEGLQFLGGWSAPANGLTDDTGITYEITVTDPTKFLISDFHISSNASVTPRKGTGTVNITDSFYADANLTQPIALDNGFGTIVSSAGAGLGLVDLSDGANVSGLGLTSVWIHKDIAVNAGNGTAGVSLINQLVSQTPTGGNPVPEPASLGLLGAAAVGLIARRRKA